MRTAIYCRVSTEGQEEKGTSLQTQLENCLSYCQRKNYEVTHRFSETYSGLSLNRPELDKLRELVREKSIDVIVCYALDRLSRDPTHGVIITQELEKYGVKLESVSEDIDNSELGKLISYIRGFASKLEAEKIKERSKRGRRARVIGGRMAGGFHGTYGYDYISVHQPNGGRRIINENEAQWVKKMFEWLVYDGMSAGIIRNKLQDLNVPTKRGTFWTKVAIVSILKNPAYMGKTYAFTTSKSHARTKPRQEWIEIPGATPAIISPEIFEAAQKQLQANRDKSIRNTKRQYLLRGHVRCKMCGRAYVGGTVKNRNKTDRRLYRCMGKWKEKTPILCTNKSWGADKLETLVWKELVDYLNDDNLIKHEIEKQRQSIGNLNKYEVELGQVEKQLKALDREQRQLLRWALKDFPADQVETENKRLNKSKEALLIQKNELEGKIKAGEKSVISLPQLEKAIKWLKRQLPKLDYEGKRLALDMLGITVWLEGENASISGSVNPEIIVIKNTHSKESILNNDVSPMNFSYENSNFSFNFGLKNA